MAVAIEARTPTITFFVSIATRIPNSAALVKPDTLICP